MRSLVFAVLSFWIAPLCLAQSAYLVKDINTTTSSDASSSNPGSFIKHGSRIYFAAQTEAAHKVLCATDNTEVGTSAVVRPDAAEFPRNPAPLASLNENLIFAATDHRGTELWITDGTSDGTRLLADINPGSASSVSGPSLSGGWIVHAGKLLFSAHNGVNGYELWQTDGTSAGTRLLKDLHPGADDSYPSWYVSLQGAVYFSTGDALWKTDGTEAGTVVVKSGVRVVDLIAASSRLYFYGGDSATGFEPWVSDGTEAGTRMIADLDPGTASSVLSSGPATAFGTKMLFRANSSQYGVEWWVSDGTAAGTHLLVDLVPGPSYPDLASRVVVMNGFALFTAQTYSHGRGLELWKTDGTSAGTSFVAMLDPSSLSSVDAFVRLGDSAYFYKNETNRARIWKTDGTLAGTVAVTSLPERQFDISGPLTPIGGALYFAAADALHGLEPWKFEGTTVSMIANVAREPGPSSDPRDLTVAGDWVYFSAYDGLDSFDRKRILWRSDGTPEGTRGLGVAPSQSRTMPVGRSLFFRIDGQGVWFTDGTPEGTKRDTELENRFPRSASIAYVFRETIFVHVDGELWVTKQTPGASALKLASGPGYEYTNIADRVFYYTNDNFAKFTLWVSDGTSEGTHAVETISGAPPTSFVAMGGQLYFFTQSRTSLWKSDGTAAGTGEVMMFHGGFSSRAAGNKLFFTDDDGELWVSNGTAEGTRGLSVHAQGELAVAGDRLIFTAADATHGRELWVSDGTVDGTGLLMDINPGASGSDAVDFVSAGELVYFNAYTPALGNELWVTDGTSQGTRLVADLDPGDRSSRPGGLVHAGDRVFFSAQTTATGRELWAIPLPPGPRIQIEDLRTNEAEGSARFSVQLSSPATSTVTVDYATSNNTATENADYEATSGTLTFAVGESSKTIVVPIVSDASMENDEAFFLTLRNPTNASLSAPVVSAIIEDDDRAADLGLTLDFSTFRDFGPRVRAVNVGPAIATNLRATLTAAPQDEYGYGQCEDCQFVQLAPGEQKNTYSPVASFEQQYLVATVSGRERDPNSSNNSIGWTMNRVLAMEAVALAPGAEVRMWVASGNTVVPVTLESSNPSVASVPPSVDVPDDQASFQAHGNAVGTATIRASVGGVEIGTLVVDVVAPGTKKRWPGGVRVDYYPQLASFHNGAYVRFAAGVDPLTLQTATGNVIITANGIEVGRTVLSAQTRSAHVPFYFPNTGNTSLAVHYEGDMNFLPETKTYSLQVLRGNASIVGTAKRDGSTITARLYLEGTPAASPTGTIHVTAFPAEPMDVPVAPTTFGRSYVEFTVNDADSIIQKLVLFYSGDDRYNIKNYEIPVTEERRRRARH